MAYGYEETASEHILAIYDPSYPEVRTFLRINKNDYSAIFKGGWLSQTVDKSCELTAIKYVDLDKLTQYNLEQNRVASIGTEELAEDTEYAELYFRINSAFLISNADGDTLLSQDGLISGTMDVYSVKTVAAGDLGTDSEYRIKVNKSEYFTYNSISNDANFTVYQDGQYFSAETEQEGAKIVVRPGGKSEISSLQGASYTLYSSINSNAGELAIISGQKDETVSLSSTSSGQLVLDSKNALNANVSILNGLAITDSFVDASYAGPVVPKSVPVTGISLAPAAATLTAIGETKALTATVTPDNAANKSVIWTSSDPSVATVSDTGVVTAVAHGTATITATTVDGGFTATTRIVVPTESSPKLWVVGGVTDENGIAKVGIVLEGHGSICGGSFTLSYDPTICELTECSLPAELRSSMVVNSPLNESGSRTEAGTIKAAWADAVPSVKSQMLLELTFRVQRTGSALALSEVKTLDAGGKLVASVDLRPGTIRSEEAALQLPDLHLEQVQTTASGTSVRATVDVANARQFSGNSVENVRIFAVLYENGQMKTVEIAPQHIVFDENGIATMELETSCKGDATVVKVFFLQEDTHAPCTETAALILEQGR